MRARSRRRLAALAVMAAGTPVASHAQQGIRAAIADSEITPFCLKMRMVRHPAFPRMREKYKLGSDVQGVVITDVDPDSPAAEKNLQPGDVILEVQNEAVRTPDDVTRRVDAGAKAGRKAVLLLVSRDGQANYIGLSLGDAG